jgi:hypothetical protein
VRNLAYPAPVGKLNYVLAALNKQELGVSITPPKPATIATPYSDIRIIATSSDCCVSQVQA